jgi:hypothetical protein
MKIVVYAFFICGIACALLMSCNRRQSEKILAQNSDCKSRVQTSDTFLKFGDVRYGDEVGGSVWVKNIGDCPWKVKQIDVGCGCTQVVFDEKQLSPNDSVKIDIYFNTNGLDGYQMKSITIYDNSETGSIELFVSATVI